MKNAPVQALRLPKNSCLESASISKTFRTRSISIALPELPHQISRRRKTDFNLNISCTSMKQRKQLVQRIALERSHHLATDGGSWIRCVTNITIWKITLPRATHNNV